MSEPAEARKSTSVGKLAVLMVTAFMDMVGILMIIPLMPFYAKALGWLSAATNAGVALGPLLGAVALRWGTPGPGLLAAALSLVNILFAWKFLAESRDLAEASAARSQPRVRGRSRQAVLEVVTHPNEPASRLIWIYAIAIGAFQGSTAILALFLAARFGVTEKTIGYFFAYIGVLSVVARALVLGPMVDRFGEAQLSRIGLPLLSIGLALLPFMYPVANPVLTYVPLALAVALIPLG